MATLVISKSGVESVIPHTVNMVSDFDEIGLAQKKLVWLCFDYFLERRTDLPIAAGFRSGKSLTSHEKCPRSERSGHLTSHCRLFARVVSNTCPTNKNTREGDGSGPVCCTPSTLSPLPLDGETYWRVKCFACRGACSMFAIFQAMLSRTALSRCFTRVQSRGISSVTTLWGRIGS